MSAGMDRLRDAGYPRLAQTIQEMADTAQGILRAQVNFCSAIDPHTGRPCDLDRGHLGDHESFISLTWPQEEVQP